MAASATAPTASPDERAQPIRGALREAAGDRWFLATIGLFLALAWAPFRGITLWYDEAWRLVLAGEATGWIDLLGHWDPRGIVIPVSPLYLALVRIALEGLPEPMAETWLRALGLAGMMLVMVSARALAARWTSTRSAGAIAGLFLAAHAYAGFYAFSIKEHILLAAIVGLWSVRVDAIVAGRARAGWTDGALCLLAALTSSLAAFPIAAAGVLLAWAAARRRDLRALLPLLGAIAVAALFIGLQYRGTKALEAEFVSFSAVNGLPSPGPGALFGHARFPLEELHEPWLTLLGVPTWSVFKTAAGAAWFLLVAAGLVQLARGDRRLGPPVAGLAAIFAWILASHLALGMDEPRFFLWLLPFPAACAAVIVARVPARLGACALVLLVATMAPGWWRWHESYPSRIRFDSILSDTLPFVRARDVLLHAEGLTYFPHRAWDPGAPVGVLPVPEDGLPRMTLMPGFRYQGGHDVPLERLWTDTRIAAFRDGALWTVTTYGFSEAQTARLRRHAFRGANRLDTFVQYPWHWTRIGADSPLLREPSSTPGSRPPLKR